MDKKKLLKQKPSIYIFGISIMLCVAMFIYGLVNLIMFTTGENSGQYINIIQTIFSIACILLLTIYLAYIKLSKLHISEPLNIYLIMFILIFLGVYPCFDLFVNKISLGIFFAFLGFTFAIISMSIFFYFLKNQNGTLKANPWFLALFQLCFSTLIVSILEILIYLVSKSTEAEIINNLNVFISQMAYSWIGVLIVNIITIISLYKTKYFVNMCLIYQINN